MTYGLNDFELSPEMQTQILEDAKLAAHPSVMQAFGNWIAQDPGLERLHAIHPENEPDIPIQEIGVYVQTVDTTFGPAQDLGFYYKKQDPAKGESTQEHRIPVGSVLLSGMQIPYPGNEVETVANLLNGAQQIEGLRDVLPALSADLTRIDPA